jgi:hypothetical protein
MTHDLSNFAFCPIRGSVQAYSQTYARDVRVADIPDYQGTAEQKSLGALFAAAPELLKALREAERAIREHRAPKSTWLLICEVLASLHAQQSQG